MADAPEPIFKIHAELATADPPRGDSSQPKDDPYLGTPKDCIEPPLPLERLQSWTQINGTRKSCLQALVTNTVGLGYRIAVAEGHERDVSDAAEKALEAAAALESLAKRDSRSGRPTFTKLMRAVKWDEQEIGNGAMEVSRDKRDGTIDGLFHVPAARLRRKKDRTGYLLLPPDGDENNATPFYDFGTKVTYSRDGDPTVQLQKDRSWDVNEVIVFREHTSESRDYGLPVDSALALEYLGDKLAAEANVGFFDASGTPPTVLFVQGEERKDGGTVHVTVPAQTTAQIAATMKSGDNRQNRVAILPLPAGVKVQKEELGKVTDRDLGFTGFRDSMRQRTLSAFRLPPIFIAVTTDSGQYTAEVERAIGKEQVFDPQQSDWQDVLNDSLLRELGYRDLQLLFNDLAVEDDAAKREGADRGAEAGTVTRREWRRANGYEPLPEAAKAATGLLWHDGQTYKSAEPENGQVPHGWNDRIVSKAPPRGAENRTLDAEDQRGQRPGIGGRTARSGPGEQPRGADRVQAAVPQLQNGVAKAVRGGTRRSVERARAALDAED